MIQHRKNKMEAQIEMIQEMFNKDPEEIRNKQSVMNSTITEMENTLERINRINEGEEQRSQMEDRMVEITATEQNEGKGMKIMRTVSEISGTMLNTSIFEL